MISPAYLCQRAIPLMLEQGGGTIVNMSSSSVVREPPGNVHQNGWSLAYVAAKAGIDRFASILNVELGGRGIRAFNFEPGFVAYEDVLAEKLAKYPGVPVSPPEAIGPAIVWLVQSPDADRFCPSGFRSPASPTSSVSSSTGAARERCTRPPARELRVRWDGRPSHAGRAHPARPLHVRPGAIERGPLGA